MHIRTAEGVWTDGRWWHRIHLRDTRIVLVDEEDEELLVAELPSEDEASELFRVLNERLRYEAPRFEVARWLEDHASEAAGGGT
jgi:hypothetical protein